MNNATPNPECPHCHNTVDVMSASDVVDAVRSRGWEKFHVNYLGKLVTDNRFPAPWFAAAGRQFWLRADFEAWWEDRSSQSRKRAVETAASIAAGMTDAEFKRYLREIEEARKDSTVNLPRSPRFNGRY